MAIFWGGVLFVTLFGGEKSPPYWVIKGSRMEEASTFIVDLYGKCR